MFSKNLIPRNCISNKKWKYSTNRPIVYVPLCRLKKMTKFLMANSFKLPWSAALHPSLLPATSSYSGCQKEIFAYADTGLTSKDKMISCISNPREDIKWITSNSVAIHQPFSNLIMMIIIYIVLYKQKNHVIPKRKKKLLYYRVWYTEKRWLPPWLNIFPRVTF